MPYRAVTAAHVISRQQGGCTLLLCVGAMLVGGCTAGASPSLASLEGGDKAVIASSGVHLSGATATAARKQNWDCRRIEPAIAKLLTGMRASKERAEKEQEQPPKTLEQMFARQSGPPGAGNAALAEYQKARSDIDQLNDLLRKRGCATYPIGVDYPAFLKR